MPKQGKYRMKSYQLCWKCKKAVGGCSWSRDLKPVDGWKARMVEYYRHVGGGNSISYDVIECPEFEGDDA